MLLVVIYEAFLLLFERLRFGNAVKPRAASNTSDCHAGPIYWCESLANAKQCGVVETCTKALSRPSATRTWLRGFRRNSMKKSGKAAQVTIYYESLCPACKHAILNVIWPAYQTLASTKILNLEFIPFGNGQEFQNGGNPVISCQHGQPECTGNVIEACGTHLMKRQSLYVPFIACLEMYEPNESTAEYCSKHLNFDYNPIKQCVHGPLGIKLQHQMAARTKALSPPHQVVPWITLNGFHSDEMQQGLMQNMIGFVCGAYTGEQPAMCKQHLGRAYLESSTSVK